MWNKANTATSTPWGNQAICLSIGVHMLHPMALVPRWRYMTDEAKALTKRTAVTALVVLAGLLVFRALLPWIVLALVAWWLWKAVRR